MGWDGGFTPEQPDTLPEEAKVDVRPVARPERKPSFIPALAN